MVSFTSRLRRNSITPLSLAATQTPASPTLSTATLSPTSTKRSFGSPLFPAASAVSADAYQLSKATDAIDEDLWYGSPVFDARHWFAKGNMELVRLKHAEMRFTAEALTIVCSSTNEADCSWSCQCLELGWPSVCVVEIDYDVCNVESDALATRWLRVVQNRALFPIAYIYRLRTHWAGCSEVFEHPLINDLSKTLAKRFSLVSRLPQHVCNSEYEMCFYKYRLLFLTGVSFRMSEMAKSEQGTLAMYTYITYILKTDLFEPISIEFTDAQPQHMQDILNVINKNPHQLEYSKMRVVTANAALQSSLRHVRLDMHNMTDGRHSIPFCAAHFPWLESLVVSHSPDFKGTKDNLMSLGVLFSLPWINLVELQLPFISDSYAMMLKDKCPSLQFFYVYPEPRYERWPAYDQPFTSDGLYVLATQWPKLRHLVINYAFRSMLQSQPTSHALLSPSRLSFGGGRPASIIGKSGKPSYQSESRIFGYKSMQQQEQQDKEQQSTPGAMSLDSFTIYPRNRNLRVLRIPYLQLPFSTGLALLRDIPQLQIFEFMPVLKDTTPKSPGIASTLRRRVSASRSPQFNAPFADPDVVYHLKTSKHPLKELILHEASTTRYISSSWIEIMNSFIDLVTVTLVAVNQEDLTAAGLLMQFCKRNDAKFDVDIDDQSRRYQTCVDFANSWEKMGDLLWK
ncbi:hypothetical protein GGI25_002842 [Coemansia spiralis]|uniref:Uncharacterized protein n=2 Tax=Coemansia TaxID=4863 RepID=A0A9W8KY60_9FUNG|nr:hypothetical protein BX070DRAFT_225196 [Coemansia spiralis]KAJ1987931.1 hypothetical protein EDC05_005570 [Coemansia umbellata]KAJ2622310.1 hypothetical protein GGI26_003321 [Coemansia sp. RSA 1358]KAJ2677890.1 hypothetical protein GGI25_002842 [Coemansia spiralis]